MIDEHRWPAWEVEASLGDLLRLGEGADCPYDRPSVGPAYALWYHCTRTHDALRVLRRRLGAATGRLRIVDLGCGTGASASAVALHLAGTAGAARVDVVGVDTSPFMVETAVRIHECLVRRVEARDVAARFTSAAWSTLDAPADLIVGGFLLDQSDQVHAPELANRLESVASATGASEALIYTTFAKRDHLDRLRRHLSSLGWNGSISSCTDAQFAHGEATRSGLLRSRWYAAAGIPERLRSRSPAWVGGTVAVLEMRRPAGSAAPTLFQSGLPALLDAEQEAAATPDGRMSVIVGTAGSGKSVVLAHRIVRTVLATRPADPPPRILVTAFNKGVIDLLAGWVHELMTTVDALVGVECTGETGRWTVAATYSTAPVEVHLLNFDKLPGQVFGVRRQSVNGWQDDLQRRKDDARPMSGYMDRLLTVEFLEDEFEQVIYGRSCLTRDSYLTVRREGRPRLPEGGRELLWRILMEPEPVASFVSRRYSALKLHSAALESGRQLRLPGGWTHLFADECQDLTPADFRLFASVPPAPHAFVTAGDESQALHLGRTYRRPGIRGARWEEHRLSGSYRLPLRVCEALQPLSQHLVNVHGDERMEELDALVMESRKAAVPGPRPVVLAGGQGLGKDLGDVLGAYRTYLLSAGSPPAPVLFAERDTMTWASAGAATPAFPIQPGHMLAMKGREFPCVVFSNRAPLDDEENLDERVFTALTRATSLLILVVWPGGSPRINRLLGMLGKDRLLFWNAEALNSFERERAGLEPQTA